MRDRNRSNRVAKTKIALEKLEEILSNAVIVDKTGEMIEMNDGRSSDIPMKIPARPVVKPRYEENEEVLLIVEGGTSVGTVKHCYFNGTEYYYVVHHEITITTGGSSKFDVSIIRTEFVDRKYHESNLFRKVY